MADTGGARPATLAVVAPAPGRAPAVARAAAATAADAARRGWRVVRVAVRFAADPPVDGADHTLLLPADAEPGDHAFGDPAAERALAEILRDERVDCVHLHWGGAPVLPALVERCWFAGVPAVVELHQAWGLCTCERAGSCPACVAAGGGLRQTLLEVHVRESLPLADRVLLADEATERAAGPARWPGRLDAVAGLTRSALAAYRSRLHAELVGRLAPPASGPRLTAVVTAYRRPDGLRRCLDSLAGQTLPADRFEVVVVDDASPEPLAGLVAGFADRLDLRYLRHERNQGLGAARNTGIAAATGEVVLLLDDDDVAAPRCLAEHLRVHAEDPRPTVAALGYTGIAPEIDVDAVVRQVFRVGRQYMGFEGLVHGEDYGWEMFWGGRVSAKRSLLAAEPFTARFLEDTDLAFRLRDHGLTVRYTRHAVHLVTERLDHAAMCRRVGRMGEARTHFLLGRCDDPAVENWYAPRHARQRLARTAGSLAGAERVLADGLDTPLPLLRRRVAGERAGRPVSRLWLLDASLGRVYGFHHDLGMLVPQLRELAGRTGGLRVGVDLAAPELAEVVAAYLELAPPAGTTLVVRTEPTEAAAQAAYDRIAALVAAAGRDVATIPAIEITGTGGPEDVHVSCSVAATDWRDERPLPLPDGPLAEALRRLLRDEELQGALR